VLELGFIPENDLDIILEWEAESRAAERSWVDRAAIPCDLWLVQASLRAHQLLLGKIRRLLGLNRVRARSLVADPPARIMRRVSLGRIFRWLDNTGLRRIASQLCSKMLRFGIRGCEPD